MAAPAYTYVLTNGSTADASQVQQNFTDILNGISDGTKDLSINALTLAGALTANGHVNLGNASADDLTVTASLASTIPIKTTNAFDIGSSTLGLRALYFGANSQTTKIVGSASMSATWTLTLPVSAGTDGHLLQTNGSGVSSWVSTITGAKIFSSTVTVGGNTTGDSNLGTIDSVTLGNHYVSHFTANFNTGLNTSTSNLQIDAEKTGSVVTLTCAAATLKATALATTATWSTSGTPIPSSMRPAVNLVAPVIVINNNTDVYEPAFVYIQTTGAIAIFRQNNWTNTTTNCGFNAWTVSYRVA